MIDYKHWYKIHTDINKKKTFPLTDDADFYGLALQDYFVMNRILHHTRPKSVGWIGGFSNLDFFLSQYGVDSITKCTNVDHTPVGNWCKQKHKTYIEKYQYKGQYEFIEKIYERNMLTNVDFLSTLSAPLDQIPFDRLENIKTLVVYHYGSPRNINSIKAQIISMPQQIITNNIVVYSSHDLAPVTEDCAFLTKIGTSDIGKIDDCTFVAEKSEMAWEDIISGLTCFKN